jgi:hypothetical protein
LALHGDDLYWSDAGRTPVNRVNFDGRTYRPLADAVSRISSFEVKGADIFWMGSRNGEAASCSGGTVIKEVHQSALDGSSTLLLAEGSNCSRATPDLVVDDAHLYFVDAPSQPVQEIVRVPREGGERVTVARNTSWRKILGLAGDATHLYWLEEDYPPSVGPGSVLVKMPKAGGPPQTLAEGLKLLIGGLRLDGDDLLFAETDGSLDRILSMPTGGGALSVLAEVTHPVHSPKQVIAFAVDEAHVYWLDSDALNAKPRGAGSSAELASGLAFPRDLESDGTTVVWTEESPHASLPSQVKSVPALGGAPTVLLADADRPTFLSIIEGQAYYVEGSSPSFSMKGASTIRRVPLAGGPAETVLGGVATIYPPIATDGTSVFIGDGERIKKVPVDGGRVE